MNKNDTRLLTCNYLYVQLTLWRRASGRNACYTCLLPNFGVSLPHCRGTTVSLDINLSYKTFIQNTSWVTYVETDTITDTDHHSYWHELLSFVFRLSYFQGSSVFPSILSLVDQRYEKINISYHLYYLWIKSARVTGNFLKALSLRGFCSLCFDLGATNYIFYFWPIKDRTVPAKFPKCFNGALW